MLTLRLQPLGVPTVQRLLMPHVNWQAVERTLEELGDRRSSLIAYSGGTLAIRMPSPEQENARQAAH